MSSTKPYQRMTSNTLKRVDLMIRISDYRAFRISIIVSKNRTLRKSQDLGIGIDRYDDVQRDFTLSHSRFTIQDSRLTCVSLIQTY